MVTNQNFLNIIKQIAGLFCQSTKNPVICKTTVEARLKTYLTNTLFSYFLSNLSTGRFYYSWISKVVPVGSQFLDLTFNWVDIITGDTNTPGDVIRWPISVPPTAQKIVESHAGFKYMGSVTHEGTSTEYAIFQNPGAKTYGISYVPPAPIGGGSGSSGSSSTNGGSSGSTGGQVIVTPPSSGGSPAPVGSPGSTAPETSGIFPSDLQNLLIPAGIVLVAWLMLKK